MYMHFPNIDPEPFRFPQKKKLTVAQGDVDQYGTFTPSYALLIILREAPQIKSATHTVRLYIKYIDISNLLNCP